MKAKNEIFNKLYLLYFISLPLVFSKSIIDPVLVPRQIHLGFFCIVTLAFMYFTKGENNEFTFKKEFKYLPIALLIFGGINLISISQANVLSEAYFVVSRISTTILFFFITIILLIRNQLLIDTLFKGVFCFATISLLIAGYQIIYNDDLNLISSTMANKNLLSSALFLCLPFLMIYKNEWKNYKYVQYSLITLLLIVLFYIRTRAVIIPLIIGGAIYLANKIYHVVKLKNRTRLSFFVVVGILCLLFSLFYINHNTSLGSFTDSNTFNTRVKLWHNTKYIIADNTLLGVGPGNWKFKFANYGIGNLLKEASDGRMIYQQPHNDFLEFFADSGLLAFLGYIALYVITAFYLMQLYKSANLNEDKEKYFIFLIALLGFAFISFFDFPMERVEHQVLFFTLLAVVLYYFSSLKDSQNLLNINFKTRYLFVLIFAGVFTAAVSIYIGT
ncbi:MAG: O-antigen ligase family protein, partial [Bacteroidota bacterium]